MGKYFSFSRYFFSSQLETVFVYDVIALPHFPTMLVHAPSISSEHNEPSYPPK
jgi:hypothetical protein